MMKIEEEEMAKAKAAKKQETVDIFGDDELETESVTKAPAPLAQAELVPPIDLQAPAPAPVVVEAEKPGVSKEAVEGILKQVQDSRAVLAGSSSAKVQRAVGKLTEATTWLKDALKDK